jgi:hypothetical protein
MSDIQFSMGCSQIEPLEYIQSCPSKSPIDEGLQFKDEWNCHKSLECYVINDVVAVHQEVTFLHFSYAIPDLESTDPEIAAV